MKYTIRKSVLAAIFLLLSSQALANSPVVVPVSTPLVWAKKNIVDSHINYAVVENTSKVDIEAAEQKPVVLIEPGGNHVTVLDGNKLESVIRFSVRSALHEKPIYDSTGHYVYLSSPDGWVSLFDLNQLKMVSEIRVGLDTSSIAISGDDRFIIVGNNLPNTLVVLDAKTLSLVKVIPAIDRKVKSSRVSAVYDAKPRRSFLASLKDSPELWEISYQTPPPAGFGEWVHDYRKDSGEADVRSFPVRRLSLTNPINEFFLDQEYVHVIASTNKGRGQVIDLDLGRKVFDLDTSTKQDIFSGVTWNRSKDRVLAITDPKGVSVNIINMKNWEVIKKIPTQGPVFVIQSLEGSSHVWIEIVSGKNKNLIQVFDKQSLAIVKTLHPQSGKTFALRGFTRDGRYALVSQNKTNAVVIVYDVKTLKEVKRIPITKPLSKSAVYN